MVDRLGDIEHKVECDGGPYCQADEHIEGCFATERRYVQVRPGEIEALRCQLAGAVEERDALAKLVALYREHSSPDLTRMVNHKAMRTPPTGGR